MQRFAVLTFTLTVLISAGIVLALTIGSARPFPTVTHAMFTNPDGSPCEKPCLFGIRAGSVLDQNGFTLAMTHPLVRRIFHLEETDILMNIDCCSLWYGQSRLTIDGDSNKDYYEVDFAADDPDFSVGQLLLRLGSPSAMEFLGFGFGRSSGITGIDVFLDYPDKGLEIFLIYKPDSNMQPSDRPAFITLAGSGHLMMDNPCVPPYCQHWQGFKSIRVYTQGLPTHF